MKKIFLLLSILLIFTSCKKDLSKSYSIGRDKNWYGVALDGDQKNLNGFILDLLLEMGKEKHVDFELVDTNWSSLFYGLDNKKYAGAFSNLTPYNFNRDKYDFSNGILDTGYSLVALKNLDFDSLDDFTNKYVGYIQGERS